jgi:hypothetical protein
VITDAQYDRLEAISDEVTEASRNGTLSRERYDELRAEVGTIFEGERMLFPFFDGLPIPADWTE